MDLEKLAEEIEDVSDPSSIDKVLIYLEELQNESEEFIELLAKKLEHREITWEQPWYQASSSITKPHKPFYDRNDGECEATKFRTDKITQDEHDRILKNWKRFTKKYDVPDKLDCFVRWRNEGKRKKHFSPEERARRFIAAYLSRGLQRTLEQVYTYAKCFHLREGNLKCVYNATEEKIIQTCLMHKLNKAPAILSIVLGRHPRGLSKRRNELKTGKPEKKRKKWNLELAAKLLKLMIHHSELPLEKLKYAKLAKSTWLQIQEEMDRDHMYLIRFWEVNLHVQLFVKCDVKLYKIRRKLLKLLRDSSYKVWSDIRWPELVQYFPDGVTHRFLYKMCCSLVRKHPQFYKTPLEDLANFGLQTIKSSRYTNKRLKRLIVNSEGNLERIKYTSDKQNT